MDKYIYRLSHNRLRYYTHYGLRWCLKYWNMFHKLNSTVAFLKIHVQVIVTFVLSRSFGKFLDNTIYRRWLLISKDIFTCLMGSLGLSWQTSVFQWCLLLLHNHYPILKHEPGHYQSPVEEWQCVEEATEKTSCVRIPKCQPHFSVSLEIKPCLAIKCLIGYYSLVTQLRM